VPELIGVEAYLEIGSALRQGVGTGKDGVPLELLSECVKAVIQSETFMLLDRGYASPEAYEEYWDEMYLNSCRYYSNLSRITGGYLAGGLTDYRRTLCLFNRIIDCRVSRLAKGGFAATGGFCDSAHELSLFVEVDEAGVVTCCAGNFLRAPDVVCRENKLHIAKLVGRKLAGVSKKDIGGQLGGGQGCVHLVDLAYALNRAITAGMER
jgi:hypothetical protein